LKTVPTGKFLFWVSTAFFTSVGDNKSGELAIVERLILGKIKSTFFFSVPNVLICGEALLVLSTVSTLLPEHFLQGFRMEPVEWDRVEVAQHLSLLLTRLVRLCILLDEVLGSLLVVKVETILLLISGEALTTFDTLIFGLVSLPSLLLPGDNLHVILSLKYFTFVLSTLEVVLKQVSCLRHTGNFSVFTFIVEISLRVELFREDRLRGGDGGMGGGLGAPEGAVLL
jgi:hypothetical protein